MKKKFKLFATIGSLALAICMMTIGVLAATQVTFSVTSSVSFTTDKVYVDVTGEVAYGATASRQTKSFTGKNYTGVAGSAPAGNITLTAGTGSPTISGTGTEAQFGDIQFAEEVNNQIVYTFTITNKGTNPCFVEVTIPAYESGVTATNVTIVTECKKGEQNFAHDGSASLATNETMTLTYKLTLTDVSKSVDSLTDVDFTFNMQIVEF